MTNISFWHEISGDAPTYPTLTQDIEVDVAIIGGGITGMTAAQALSQAGKKVAVLEAQRIGGVTTGYSTGNLYIPVQPYYQHIASKFSFAVAKEIAHSRQAAINYIENTILEKNIQCDFHRRPWYAYTSTQESMLGKEVALLKKMDLPVTYTKDLPLPFSFKKAMVMPAQARFNPLKYVRALAADLKTKGCLIFEKTRVIELIEKQGVLLKTKQAIVRAQNVIIATHIPIGINSTQMFTAPYRSYVIAVQQANHQYPEGHFWDIDQAMHTCTHAMNAATPEVLMVAGSHHKTGQGKPTGEHYDQIQTFIGEHFPQAQVKTRWSAQHYRAADNVPYIGLASHFAKHTFIATGFFADGLVYGTLSGLLLADLILKQKNVLSKTYKAQRFKPLASAPFLIKENSNVFLQYLKDYPQVFSPKFTEIKAGEGKIVEINREKCAVSRDEHNQLCVVSAVCPHMKCIVNWNQAEKTWDCPCHGSRFTAKGELIEGPAQSNLEIKSMLKIND